MTTLYIRDVPDDVASALKSRAAAAGQSLSTFVTGELAKIAARPTKDEVLDRLRRTARTDGPTTAEIVEHLDAARR